MADYIYLLQTRLTPAQQTALQHVRDVAKAHAMTVFLVGGAVRDLTSGSPVRDLDIAIQGNATKLKKDIQKVGATLIGEHAATQSLFFNFPGGVRVEVSSALSATWPKPGKPVFKPATILEDLRRRDFTANAMAISLNEGSLGLLMDPLNGIADLENRELRLVSNYGFIEDPVRMIRSQRLVARMGWHLEEKTHQRYETGKAEGYISAMSEWDRGYELEEILHEEDPLRVLRRLESEGWMQALFPALSAAKANENEISKIRDLTGQLEVVSIFADPSAVQFPSLVAKLTAAEVTELKALLARPGFVEQIAALEPATREFGTTFAGKAAAVPSDAWKLLHVTSPEVVLSLAHSSKSSPVQARFTAFFNDWSQARTKVPYQLMQEMRITPDLPGYAELIEKLHFAIMDGQLETVEMAKAFLEPYSPPAPPPPPTLRRRAAKATKTSKAKAKKATPVVDETLAEMAAAESPALPPTPTPAELEAFGAPAPKASAPKVAAKKATESKPVEVKVAAPVKAATVKKDVAPAKAAPAKPAAAKAAPAKPTSHAPAKPVSKAAPAKAAVPAKVVAASAKKPAAKPVAKAVPAKSAAKAVPAKKVVAKAPLKPAPKKAPAKPAKKAAPAKKAPKRR
ncbi:Poly A polymerase head domain-containing protein [Bryocella elongata]|uniref:Poly A polymerase head domain-containing protein n=1 Tax=Bryocella elongata TaxID=863522 RepID=A0A1H5TUV2_9BACT|nr:CCA tRNA nucleotidyltransferase [Bryocella elongata]SEF66566.1 Poly A polymerase head domain-containing protein [Bryocella elongata]